MGAPLSFQNKHSGYMHLDRDDLGKQSDYMWIDGDRIVIKINREVVSMRGIMAGDYYINIHVYNKGEKTPTKYTLTLLDVNPYREVYVMQGELNERGDIIRLPGFTLDQEGQVTDVWTSDKIIVGSRRTTNVITNSAPSYMDDTEADEAATGRDADLRQAIAQEDDI
jgi:hypothetical protein